MKIGKAMPRESAPYDRCLFGYNEIVYLLLSLILVEIVSFQVSRNMTKRIVDIQDFCPPEYEFQFSCNDSASVWDAQADQEKRKYDQNSAVIFNTI